MKPMEKAQLQALQRRMDRIPKAVRLAVKPALEASAREIVGRAKALAPVDSGALRDSIGYAFGDGPAAGTGVLRASVSSETLDADLKVTIFAGNSEVYYARFVEFGTAGSTAGQRVGVRSTDVRQNKTQGRKALRTHPGTPAQPFFMPAWRLGSKRAKSRVQRAIGKAVRAGWR